jgi:hypothetical protein
MLTLVDVEAPIISSTRGRHGGVSMFSGSFHGAQSQQSVTTTALAARTFAINADPSGGIAVFTRRNPVDATMESHGLYDVVCELCDETYVHHVESSSHLLKLGGNPRLPSIVCPWGVQRGSHILQERDRSLLSQRGCHCAKATTYSPWNRESRGVTRGICRCAVPLA